MKTISYIFFFFTITVSFAQSYSFEEQREIDSLNAVVNNSKSHDTIVIMTLLELTNHYYLNNPDTAIIICETAKKKAESINFPKGKANAYEWIGYLIQQQGDIPKSLDYYFKALKIRETTNDEGGIAYSLNNIGYTYKRQGNIPKAIDYYQKSLTLAEKLHDSINISGVLYNLAAIYDDQGDANKSLDYYQKAIIIQSIIGDKRGVSYSLNNIGSIYKDALKSDSYTMYQQDSLQIKAIENYQKAFLIQEELTDKNGMITSLHNIGSILYSKGDINKALQFGLRSFKLAKEIGYPAKIKVSAQLLSNIYEKQNKGIKALKLFKLYVTMKDSINNEATQKAAAQQQAKYEYEKQKSLDDAKTEKLMALQEKESEKKIAIEKEEKEKQKTLTYTAGGGFLLVIGFLLFVFNRLRVTKKQKTIIEKQKDIVEEAHFELGEKNKEITDSIKYAKRIQSAILPPLKVVKQYLQESFILYKPKDIVAGDFYWLEHKGDKILFAAADCTGHGVPGAMVSVICNNGLNRSVREHGLTDPGGILDKTREIVIQEFEKSEDEVKDGMDIALCSLKFEVRGSKLKKTTSAKNPSTSNFKPQTTALLQYAGAHNPLWIIRNGEITETKADKEPIGKFDKQTPYTTHTFELQKGDTIYIFSDGYVDQFGGERGKKFKAKAFRELLLSIQDKNMNEQRSIIDEAFEVWRGDLEQIDDVCVIGVRV